MQENRFENRTVYRDVTIVEKKLANKQVWVVLKRQFRSLEDAQRYVDRLLG